MDHKTYFSNLLDALNFEREDEMIRNQDYLASKSITERVKDGYSWYPVKITNASYGLGDTPFIEIERSEKESFKHQFSAGSTIQVFNQQGNKVDIICKGQIQYVQENKMKIFLNKTDHPDELDFGKIGIDLLVDEASYLEMTRTLKGLHQSNLEDLPPTYSILHGQSVNEYSDYKLKETLLNEAQNSAVLDIINSDSLSIIYGPPGTGKSTTIIEAIKQLKPIEQYKKPILVCAPSNAAVDHLVKQANKKELAVVRIGNISRINDSVYDYTLEELVKKHDDYKYVKKIKKNAGGLRKTALQYKRKFGHTERQQRKSVLIQAKEMMKDANLMEDSIIDDIIDKADIICTTLVGSNHRYIKNRKFNICIIDEAGQSLEPACWIPISKSLKVILAGDPKQLPPTVKSRKAENIGLKHTLFEKLIEETGIASFLDTQYRMNELIMGFSNEHFYERQLIAHESNKMHSIDDIPIEFIDTAGCGFDEQQDKDSKSLFNKEEIKILSSHLEQLPPNKALEVGIISPYRAQVHKLQDRNWNKDLNIRIDTIDAFQGQEADIIYISLVRSNENNEIGFLKDYRRMNVAMTRAKKKLVLIGDSATLGKDVFYKDLLDYFELNDAYKSAWEYIEF